MRALLAACVLTLALSGCGSSGDAPQNATDAYNRIFRMWKTNDGNSACKAMSQSYQHKVMASLLISDDCQAAVFEIYKQLSGPDATKNLWVKPAKGPARTESVIVNARLKDGDARTRFDFQERDGKMILVSDRSLDATGPQAPVRDYRAALKAESPEVLWSRVEGETARVWEIRGNGSGSYTLIEVTMKRDDSGKWVIKSSKSEATVPEIKPKDSAAV
ncbi:MAG: hypothetical protein QM648_11800 [Solirubrobacterales bacterium]